MLAVLDATMREHLRAVSVPDAPDVLETLITLFLDQTPLVLDDLEEALARPDLLTARILVERLKGSSAVLGGLRLAFLCESLDVQLRTKPIGDLTMVVVLLGETYEQLAD